MPMRGQSWTIAKFKGVRIQLHLTLLLVLPYLAFVTSRRFQELAAEAGVSAGDLALSSQRLGPLAWGLLLAFTLFGSVLVHEMAHVTVAIRQGSRVRSILLMMLGGISDIDTDGEPPKEETRLALIGPATSLTLALVGYALWRLAPGANLKFFANWVFKANLVLGIFNLLPAFPLDGGRALRASLSARMGAVRATRIAVRVSHGFAWFFGALGLLSFNLFLVLIAFFVYAAAQAEWAQLMSRSLLEGLHAGEVATIVPPVADSQTLSEAIVQMLNCRVTALPVAYPSGRASVITLQQVRSVPFHFRDTTRVRDIVPPAEEAKEALDWDTPLATAMGDLASAPNGILAVREGDTIIGIVKHSDLTQVLQLRSIEKPAA